MRRKLVIANTPRSKRGAPAMRVDFTLSSLSDNEWPILRRVPGLGSKPLLAAELGEARGLECHPLQRPGGAVAGVRHRAALHRGAHAWRVGHSGFHLPRNPLTRIAKDKRRKTPHGLLRSDRQTTNFERLEFSLLITLCMRLPLQHDRSLLWAPPLLIPPNCRRETQWAS